MTENCASITIDDIVKLRLLKSVGSFKTERCISASKTGVDTMGDAQWVWVVRLLGVFLLVPLRVSKGVDIVCFGRPAFTAAVLTCTGFWTLGAYLLVWSIVEQANSGCFHEVIDKTMSVYNATIVVTVIDVSTFFTNLVCLARMYRRDLVNIIGRNLNLYAKADGKFKDQPSSLSTPLKALLIFLFLSPFVVVISIAVFCGRQV